LLLAVTQGLQLRAAAGELPESHLTNAVMATRRQVEEHFDFLEEDRPLEATLRQMTLHIQQQKFELYP
ncbi:MAG: hypothetical protein R3208_22890, partial [Ketobacteraceae bacterium]|nr:hypothetical protein [Ketobacteraceae bacterium]